MKTHPPPRPRVSIVVLTHNRRAEVLRTVGRLRALPERPPIVVVDNASDDGTRDALRAEHPDVRVIALPDNLGAAARNAGVREVQTRYVAFCDDDTFWAPGALSCAADALDMHPHVAVISARVLVGPEEHEDPTCALMAHSPLCGRGLPGPALLGFMAGACAFRTRAYLCMGGYEQRLFIGAEESLLASISRPAAGAWRTCRRWCATTTPRSCAMRSGAGGCSPATRSGWRGCADPSPAPCARPGRRCKWRDATAVCALPWRTRWSAPAGWRDIAASCRPGSRRQCVSWSAHAGQARRAG